MEEKEEERERYKGRQKDISDIVVPGKHLKWDIQNI